MKSWNTDLPIFNNFTPGAQPEYVDAQNTPFGYI